ncbi:ArfGap-domain-containing protein [Meredithblackwellia eburnea MCA 4105]
MSAEYDTKARLLDLMKEEENKTCIDCDVPMPQWASLSFGVFCCLTCSGAHRGLGVHISFVRSLTMDKWTDAQFTKMKEGGNKKCREFFEAHPDYSKDMSIQDKYTSHFAAQYKDKLAAQIEGREWKPSDTPAPAAANSAALRKPRSLNSRGPSPQPSRTASLNSNSARPASPATPGGLGGAGNPYNQKARNEEYFANMGAANETRSEDLPPSQGGKYTGFGSDGGYNPSRGTSSRALPGLDDIRDDPMSALSRGWGFLGSALSQASKTINESVVQPTMERAADPALSSQLSGYLSKAGSALSEGARVGGGALASGLQAGSSVIKRDLGYDVGDLGATYIERATGRGAGQGYGQVGTFSVPSAEAQESGDDFFGQQMGGSGSNNLRAGYSDQIGHPSPGSSTGTSSPALQKADYGAAEDGWAKLAPQSASRAASGRASPAVKKPPKKDDWDDFGEWKND